VRSGPDRATHTRWDWCSSSSSLAPDSVWSSWIPILITSAYRDARENADPTAAAEYAAAASGVSVWQNVPEATHPLQLQFLDIDPAAQAVFGLNPIRDRKEYAALSGLLAASRKGRAVVSGPDALLSSENPDTRRLGLRAANPGVSTGLCGVAAREAHWLTNCWSRLPAVWLLTWARLTP
jgi:hypothetical protein